MIFKSLKHISFVFFFLVLFSSYGWGQPSDMGAPSAPKLSEKENVQTSLEEINRLMDKGNLLEAKAKLQSLPGESLSEADSKSVQDVLEQLNLKILFSPTQTPDSLIYTVLNGDSLSKIAKKHSTTIDLIKKSNSLEKDQIRSGMKLKISKATYSIAVDISKNQLKLWSGGEVLKTYPVATGKPGYGTPTGTFTIVNKLEHPTWYKAGAVKPPDSPGNILGTRWLGFSLKGYGIHGTTLPETIGAHASDGCIRMLNQDVEELYVIVPTQTKVTVTD